MRKALLLARHDIVGQYSDRGSLLRSLFFVVLPIVLVSLNRGTGASRGSGDVLILVFALYSALLPAASAINAAAGSFAGEKEAQTLVPLIAAPIRDIDIVAGKLIATLVPAVALSVVSLTTFYVAASVEFGSVRVSRILQPATLYACVALGLFFVLTLGSWVMVLSARVNNQRSAQQIAGVITGGMFIGLTAVGSVVGQNIASNAVLLVIVVVLASDLVALELARRLWNREEVAARL